MSRRAGRAPPTAEPVAPHRQRRVGDPQRLRADRVPLRGAVTKGPQRVLGFGVAHDEDAAGVDEAAQGDDFLVREDLTDGDDGAGGVERPARSRSARSGPSHDRSRRATRTTPPDRRRRSSWPTAPGRQARAERVERRHQDEEGERDPADGPPALRPPASACSSVRSRGFAFEHGVPVLPAPTRSTLRTPGAPP